MFQFRQFTICQEYCAMKVGTDGVLLGAWAQLPPTGRLLDIGTGTGLLALMAAQRSACVVTAIEVDKEAAAQAKENALRSPWSKRINIVCTDIRHFNCDTPFDVILSNPPYYDGPLAPPDTARAAARHTNALNYEELATCAERLLAPDGTFSVVLPIENAELLVTACAARGLYTEERTTISTKATKPPRRTLLRFSRRNVAERKNTILLLDNEGNRSAEFAKLTCEFYIK